MPTRFLIHSDIAREGVDVPGAGLDLVLACACMGWVEITREEYEGTNWRKDLAKPLESYGRVHCEGKRLPVVETQHGRWIADRKRAASGGLPPLQKQQLDAMMARRAAAELREQNARSLAIIESCSKIGRATIYADDYEHLTGHKALPIYNANAKRTRT